jgi:Bifunctional DNA primase/polymerase, N-terminal/Primase C terminal 2 (PriCT-2)
MTNTAQNGGDTAHNGEQNGGGTNSCLAAALEYAARGWYVFPAPAGGAKKSLKAAKHSNGAKWGKTRAPDVIRADWRRWPSANVGVPTGRENGFWVLECDTVEAHGVDGIASLRALEAEHGPLPPTLMSMSPSGSPHRYFKWPAGDIKVKNSASEIAPGIDVRGEGGMVICPPSLRGDGVYRWLNDLPMARAPEWLIALVTTRRAENSSTRRSSNDDEVPIEKVRAELGDIPNDASVGWETWNRVAMATFGSTGGSDAGLDAFMEWSKKSPKHDDEKTRAKWQALRGCPPNDIGFGTLRYLANSKLFEMNDSTPSCRLAARPALRPGPMILIFPGARPLFGSRRSQTLRHSTTGTATHIAMARAR